MTGEKSHIKHHFEGVTLAELKHLHEEVSQKILSQEHLLQQIEDEMEKRRAVDAANKKKG
jgi:hypothetical protein